MHRAQVVGNQRCVDRVHEREFQQHKTRLRSVKPSIDNNPPKVYPHLYQKLKKAQVEEDRCAEIERNNRTLVKRMTTIMQRSGIDDGRPANAPPSLNTVRRRQEMARITKENYSLLKRIQERPPTYNHLQWEQDRERNERLCERICRHPYRPAKGGNAAANSFPAIGSATAEGDRLPPIDSHRQH
jgi:hypothetical protein